VNDLTKLARDVGYVLLGSAVLRVQRAQVRRRELEGAISGGLQQVSTVLPEPLRSLVKR
jgi:hypothetical protein